ncbi:hypothetical protein [Streptomyces californicus]|uniref:hypothetical protein n=1 Tax=Streptomyces californicus TaxID=67351 RepID=UPI0033C400A5
MITAASNATALLSGVRGALRAAGVSQLGDRPGLPHLPEVETWLNDGEVLLKVTVAPQERPGAGEIPGRVQDALRSGGFTLAPAFGSATATSLSPATELGSGRAVHIIRGQ